MIGRTLVDLRELLIPVHIMNLRRIKKGSVIASSGFVESVLGIQSGHDGKAQNESGGALPAKYL